MKSNGEERKIIDGQIMEIETELGEGNLSLSSLPVEEQQEQVRQSNTQIALMQKSFEERGIRQQESQHALTKILERSEK